MSTLYGQFNGSCSTAPESSEDAHSTPYSVNTLLPEEVDDLSTFEQEIMFSKRSEECENKSTTPVNPTP